MSIRYVVQPRFNPQKREDGVKYYIAAKSIGSIDRKVLVEDMVRNTSLTKNEAETGINYLFDAIPRFLALGFTVKLGELGYFRSSVTSEGAESVDEAKPDKVKKLRVRFIPGNMIRKMAKEFMLEKFPE